MTGLRRRSRGISLIEALVALAVMAFGTLAVLGVQSSLRFNSDISKQRSEALRLAQQDIEQVRSLDTLADFIGLDDAGPDEITSETGETTFTLTREVETAPAPADENDVTADRARYKSVSVSVAWTDRTGVAQLVALATVVHGALPSLSGSLSIPANLSPARTPLGRHVAVPQEAVDQGDGTSTFTPPGAPDGVVWTFSNVTGVITRLCDTCAPVNALLLTGYVRFALTAGQPSGIDAELPASPASLVGAAVAQTDPADAPAPTCYARLSLAYVTYYCAVVANSAGWSGRATLVPNASLLLSNGVETTHRRVCRYTPVAACDPAVGATIWGLPNRTAACAEPDPQTIPATPSRTMTNADHPSTYVNVKGALLNQNYLVIPAGDGATAFSCPPDDAFTPFVNGQTRQHQP